MHFPNIDPVAISIGPFNIYWYAISYIIGIFGSLFYAQKISDKYSLGITKEDFDRLFTYIILGILIGGRAGYVLIYDPIKYLSNPLEALQTYKGGMSFHGGFVGFIASSYMFCKARKIEYFKLMDVAAIVTPLAIFLVRIANFVNAELYGRVTTMPWGIIFPDSDGQPRHPSQIYEALTEGAMLLLIMRIASKNIDKRGYNIGFFLMFYALSRIFCEFFREPDAHIGFLALGVTMGQLLSIPMLILGVYFWSQSKTQSQK